MGKKTQGTPITTVLPPPVAVLKKVSAKKKPVHTSVRAAANERLRKPARLKTESIRKLTFRGGATLMSGDYFEAVRRLNADFLETVIGKAVCMAEYGRAKTLTAKHARRALEAQGMHIYC